MQLFYLDVSLKESKKMINYTFTQIVWKSALEIIPDFEPLQEYPCNPKLIDN